MILNSNENMLYFEIMKNKFGEIPIGGCKGIIHTGGFFGHIPIGG